MEQKKITKLRQSGILVHPTSFPSPYGIGDLGKGAYDFIDFLKEAGQTLWQCLPLGPTGFGDSPYQAFSAFAGQPLIISPEKLAELELLSKEDLKDIPEWDRDHVDYGPLIVYKTGLLKKAYSRFRHTPIILLLDEFRAFCRENEYWLTDYALFMALKDAHDGKAWTEWDAGYKSLTAPSKAAILEELKDSVNYYRFVQYIFFKQWHEFRAYAHTNGIQIIGDIPIFVSPDSADVWANQELFQLDDEGYPTVVAGVPPDYFSATGQLWGNPLYDWEAHRKSRYEWWIRRIRHQLTLTDFLRVDHFRGFEAYWAVPYGEETAINGQWKKGPGADFFDHVLKAFDGSLPIIAEDLGVITPAVEALRDNYNLPGMRILQFAFDDIRDNDYLPYNYIENCVCYTGTHDNDTTQGWYRKASPESQDKVRRYLSCDGNNIHWDFIRLAMGSVARYVLFPLQDVFGLDSSCRMNTPGTGQGNWSWRYRQEQLNSGTAAYLKELSELFGRNQYSKADRQPELPMAVQSEQAPSPTDISAEDEEVRIS